MITVEELNNPKIFSDFVEKLKKGETTEEEEKIFEKYLGDMDNTLEVIKKIIKNNH